MVDSDLRFNDHVVNQANELSKISVVQGGKFLNSVDELVLNFHQNHRLVFRSLTDVGVIEVLLVGNGQTFRHLSDKRGEFFVDDFLNFVVVRGLHLVAPPLLVINEFVDFERLLDAGNLIGLFDLHLVENSVDVHVGGLEAWARLYERLGQKLPGLLVGPIANITLPEAKNFTNYVVLEELHRR